MKQKIILILAIACVSANAMKTQNTKEKEKTLSEELFYLERQEDQDGEITLSCKKGNVVYRLDIDEDGTHATTKSPGDLFPIAGVSFKLYRLMKRMEKKLKKLNINSATLKINTENGNGDLSFLPNEKTEKPLS